MRFLSLFSGIEAASVALEPDGWECVAVAEVEPFACWVLHARFGAGRPRYMPSPDAEGLEPEERDRRRAAIKAVSRLPEGGRIPNLGDVTQISDDDVRALGPLDAVIGGSPCQDLSVAGKRAGLTGTRSALFHQQSRIYDAARTLCGARFLWWENVPGAFSSNGGRDFAVVVGTLAGCSFDVPRDGWSDTGFALGPRGLVEWRTLDAQFFGLAQRRERVFAVLDSGDWAGRPPILLEPEGLLGDPAPRRGAREGADAGPAQGAVGGGEPARSLCASDGGVDREDRHTLIPEVAWALQERDAKGSDSSTKDGHLIPVRSAVAFEARYARNGRGAPDDVVPPLKAQSGETGKGDGAPLVALQEPVPILEAGKRQSESSRRPRAGTGVGQPGDPMFTLQAGARHGLAIPIQNATRGADQNGVGVGGDDDPMYTLDIGSHHGIAIGFEPRVASGRRSGTIGDVVGALSKEADRGDGHPCVAFTAKDYGGDAARDLAPTLRGGGHDQSHANGGVMPAVALEWEVRRLTPMECERLQGFIDEWTRIAYRSLPASECPDGPRYKALGNSMAVTVMRWIGRRIVWAISTQQAALAG